MNVFYHSGNLIKFQKVYKMSVIVIVKQSYKKVHYIIWDIFQIPAIEPIVIVFNMQVLI